MTLHLSIIKSYPTSPQFSNYIERTGFKNLGRDYNTIAIIGSQSSGKSTLLNNLYQTKFEVMSEEKGRGQTTQGIWISANPKFKNLILDCEGTDSKERGEERFKFEHCSSLFALAVADVLIINMWTNDVGRYTASNYGVLKIVFEMNMKLFQQECAKRIVFVLRDFDDRYDEKDKISDLIMKDIHAIWETINKPEKFKDYPPDKFFEFEFTTLPHKFYFPEKFDEEVAKFRERLIEGNSNYLFSHIDKEKNVPADGLSRYDEQMWSDIISDKDLNIPSQKEMLAKYRCNELKDLALMAVEIEVLELIGLSASKNIENFKSRCSTIEYKALSIYDENAKQYMPHVYQETRRQLSTNLAQKLYISFANQAKKFIPLLQRNMRSELEEETKKNENFLETALAIKKKYLNLLISQLEQIRYFQSWEISMNEYEEMFDEIIDNQRRVSLSEKKNETTRKIKHILDDVIVSKFDDINEDFWVEFNQDYITNMQAMIFSLKDYLTTYYKMEESEFVPLVREIEEEVLVVIKKDLNKRLKEVPTYATENFKKHFWYDEGIPRAWNKMQEAEINKLFDTYKKNNYFVFDVLKSFKIVRNPLQYFNYQKPTEEELSRVLNKVKTIIDDPNNTHEDLLTATDAPVLKKRYDEGVQEIYEDAMRRHANIVKQSVPWWAWLLIAYLGYDDIFRYVTGYGIYLLIILLGAFGVLKALGLTHLPKTMFNLIRASTAVSASPNAN